MRPDSDFRDEQVGDPLDVDDHPAGLMTDRAAFLEKANELGLELEITSTARGFEYAIWSSADDAAALTDLMEAVNAADPAATYALPWATRSPELTRWAF